MKFKEQFPGLSKFSIHREVVLGKVMNIIEVPTEIIQATCTDNQRIIDAINKIIMLGTEGQIDIHYAKNNLSKMSEQRTLLPLGGR